jgi:apolipoprotein D and lipocalin family protein
MSFDPQRYQGTWYEVGKYPMFYDKFAPVAYSTADYRYNQPGNYINILNTGYGSDDVPILSITGIGKPQNDKGDFLISFYPESFAPFPVAPFPAPYNVLWTDYDNFAFVGDFFSYYILSRRPNINRRGYKFIWNKTEELGYDVSKVKFNDLPR